jgi:hypothetical protein
LIVVWRVKGATKEGKLEGRKVEGRIRKWRVKEEAGVIFG